MRELNVFEIRQIQGYFSLDERILKVEKVIQEARKSFYCQSMYPQTWSNGFELIRQGFSIEHNVIPFVDTLLSKKEAIGRLKKKKRYFTDYLNTLDPSEKQYLVSKYTNDQTPITIQQADIDLYEEIEEIEAAINFMYGYPQKVVTPTVDNDTLDEDFDNFAELLGV